MENLPISVIVVAKNAEKTIEDCLISVCRNKPTEVIVVDGNSSDRTVEIAGRYTKRIYSDDGKGLSYARQLGAEQARQEYIAYVDSDVILTEGALATMLAEFEASDYVSLGPQSEPIYDRLTYWVWAQHQRGSLVSASHTEVPINITCGLLRRETILKYGFETSYGGYLDDLDLGYRLRKDGYRFGLSSARCYHHWRADLKSLAKYHFFLGRVRVGYIRKYGIWHAGFWPPLVMLHRLALCLIKGKLKLIPFEIVDGVVQTAGLATGFLDLIGGIVKRRQDR